LKKVLKYYIKAPILNLNTSKQQLYIKLDKRKYLTIREDGAESLQGLHETAGMPNYHTR